jgi:hypothetical protein
MRINKIVIILFLLLSACNKRINNKISYEVSDSKPSIENNFVKIYISGFYGYNMEHWEYELKTIENEHLLTLTIGNELYYNKILSDNEYFNIYNFIKEHEMEKEIKERTDWSASHDFYGSIKINIDNKIYENEIFSTQDYENNVYKLLKILDNNIDEYNYKMPIIGVGKYIR